MAGQVTTLVCDNMLGRLARWLRMLGLDAPLVRQPPPRVGPGAVLLTRREALRAKPGVIFITSNDPRAQLRQTIKELDYNLDDIKLFSRCLTCNQQVSPLPRQAAASLVPDHVWQTAARFTQCPSCGKIYWPGSHGQRGRRFLREVLEAKE